MPRQTDTLAGELAQIVGADHVLVDADLRAGYEHDLTGRFAGTARAVVRPGSVAEVAAVLRHCNERRVPVLPQGGGTGMVGASVPQAGEVVLSMRRLDELSPVDTIAASVVAGAGVTLERLQQHAAPSGYDFPVDFAARGSATVGGMIGTNAGGALAIRHGMTRAHVAGIEAVLADGRVISHLGGLLKDNTGYDLTGLMVGSEGTLGVVTRACLRLTPSLPARAVALLALDSMEDALALFGHLRELGPALQSADYFHRLGMELVCAHRGFAQPFPEVYDTYVTVECAARDDPSEALAEAAAAADHVIRDAALATDLDGRRSLWSYRESHNETIAARGVPHKLDVTVPLERVAAFEREVAAVVAARWPDAETVLYGHLGDGNVHVNVTGPDPRDMGVDDAVLEIVAAHHGSISAEHGVGFAKARYLGLSRSTAEIEVMRAIKSALDPNGILSPGRILPPVPGSAP